MHSNLGISLLEKIQFTGKYSRMTEKLTKTLNVLIIRSVLNHIFMKINSIRDILSYSTTSMRTTLFLLDI